MAEMIEIEIKSKILKHILNDLEKRNNDVPEDKKLKAHEYIGLLLEKTYLENEYNKLKFKLTTLESNIKTLNNELQGNTDPYIELFTIDEIIKQNKHENEVIKNVL